MVEISVRSAIPFLPEYVPDRKSTRLNSSHGYISYAVFCLKKKKRAPTGTRLKSTRHQQNSSIVCLTSTTSGRIIASSPQSKQRSLPFAQPSARLSTQLIL